MNSSESLPVGDDKKSSSNVAPVNSSTGIERALSDVSQVKATVTSFFSGLRSRIASSMAESKSSKDLNIHFCTERIMILSKGLPQRSTLSKSMLLPMNVRFQNISRQTSYLEKVASHLKESYEGRYMVWNLSDVSYDTSPFEDQVIQFSFPGLPTPPIEMLHQICKSVQSWLSASIQHVALIHCNSGKGRTFMTLAAYLFFNKDFRTTASALQSLLDGNGSESSPSSILVPSQHRYLEYFEQYVNNGGLGTPRTLGLVSVHCLGIPAFSSESSVGKSCRPYLQIFQGSKLLYTTVGPEERATHLRPSDVRLYEEKDEKMIFDVGQRVSGDVVLRMRHFQSVKKRITMLRYVFHTSLVELDSSSVLYLEKPDLDIAHNSKRFDNNFRLELHFGEIKEKRKEKSDATSDDVLGERKKVINMMEKRKSEEDIKDLESRLHKALEDIDSSDEEEVKHQASRHTKSEGDNFENGLLGEEDDGEELLAALHAELADNSD